MNLTNLTKGRHVYYTNPQGTEEAAIVARVHTDEKGEKSGLVNLMVINSTGTPRAALNVPYDEDRVAGTWRWMFPEQAAVSTAGSKPTMLEPPPTGGA